MIVIEPPPVKMNGIIHSTKAAISHGRNAENESVLVILFVIFA